MKRTTDARHSRIEWLRLRLILLIAVPTLLVAAATCFGFDPGSEARWRCPYTPDGACAPSRVFGYTPTIWRRWPEPHLAAVEPPKKAKPTSKVVPPTKDAGKGATLQELDKDDAPEMPAEERLPEGGMDEQPADRQPPPRAQEPPTTQPETTQPEESTLPKRGAKPGDDLEEMLNEPPSSNSSEAPAIDRSKATGDPFFDDKDPTGKESNDTSSSLRLPGEQASRRWHTNPIRRVTREQTAIRHEQPVELSDDNDQPPLFQPAPSARPIEDGDEPPVFQPEAARPIERASFQRPSNLRAVPTRVNPLRGGDDSLRSLRAEQPLRVSSENRLR